MDVILRHIIMRTKYHRKGESISHIKFIKAIQTRENEKIGTSFFYPPPSLLFFSWTSIFSLFTSYQIFFMLSQFCFGIILWFSRSGSYILVVFACFGLYIYTIQNTMVMGQVNVLVVLLLLYALQYHNGIALALQE